MHSVIWGVLLASALFPAAVASAQTSPAPVQRPTIVLVHGAFAESSSWNPVIQRLLSDGYNLIAVANPLRGVKSDAAYLSSVITSIPGPLVLVGHSYGGEVISGVSDPSGKVRALVYVSGLAPDIGESASMILARFPGSTLGPTLAPPVPLPDGSKDLYILPTEFHAQFAADISASDAAEMAVTQRPIEAAAFDERAVAALWKTVPSWFIYGSLDKNIPASAHRYMAERARAREIVEVQGSSHVVMLSHPSDVVAMIERAALGNGNKTSAVTTLSASPPGFELPAIAAPTSQPAPHLIAAPPLPDSLARGLVVLQYRTENLRIVEVFGPAGLSVVPRIGHLHVYVDDSQWHWVDASGEPIIIQGLPPGLHHVRIDLADPTHHVIDSSTVSFKIPQR